jgi:hypothetical protein
MKYKYYIQNFLIAIEQRLVMAYYRIFRSKSSTNYVIKNKFWRLRDILYYYRNEPVSFVDVDTVEKFCYIIGAYDSISKAKQANRFGVIPFGLTSIKPNKHIENVNILKQNKYHLRYYTEPYE